MKRMIELLVALMAISAVWAASGPVPCAPGVQWTRLRGRVKALDLSARTISLIDSDGDLIGVPITDDVMIVQGKTQMTLKDLSLDDKVTLLHIPREHINEDAPPPPRQHLEQP